MRYIVYVLLPVAAVLVFALYMNAREAAAEARFNFAHERNMQTLHDARAKLERESAELKDRARQAEKGEASERRTVALARSRRDD